MDMVKSQKQAFKGGVSGELASSGVAKQTTEEALKWKTEIEDNDQKIFSGVICVMLKADTEEQLADYINRVKTSWTETRFRF